MTLALVLPVSAQTRNLAAPDLSGIALSHASEPVPPGPQALMDQWRGYALSGITPQFRWSHAQGDNAPPSLMSRYSRRVFSVLSATDRDGTRRSAISVAIHTAMAGETPAVGVSRLATGAMADGLNGGLQRVFVAPSFTQTFGEGGSWTLTGILAHQRFASMGMGSVAWSPAFNGMIGTRHPRSMGSRSAETSVGTGARLELVEAVNDRLSWAAALQSKLDMDSFKYYRGVYSDAGDFDVPGHVAFGASYELQPAIHLGVGVQRVFFSDIAAFTSAALPVRFLTLLGDASAPEFAWQDLTVYSTTMSWQRAAGETWSLRYTTRQQPAPTSALLRQALEPEFTNNNLAMAFSKDLGRFGLIMAAASYAPKQYFVATGPFTDRANPSRQQREFELHWGFQF